MTYAEFRKQYPWMTKEYPKTTVFCPLLEQIVGEETKIRYEKDGRYWRETGTGTEKITGEYYCNALDAVPFFRNLGGSETVKMGYTFRGYIPVKISSISPDGTQKIVRRYEFYGEDGKTA